MGRDFVRLLEMEAFKIRRDLASLATAHLKFATWECVRHRARTRALISYPDSHPFRQAVDAVCGDLDLVKQELNLCLARVTREHGPFRGLIDGFWFEDPEATLFKGDAERYRDAPSAALGAESSGGRQFLSGQRGPCASAKPRGALLRGNARAYPVDYGFDLTDPNVPGASTGAIIRPPQGGLGCMACAGNIAMTSPSRTRNPKTCRWYDKVTIHRGMP